MRIHEIVPDFTLDGVWELPTPGGPGDFPRLVELMASLDPTKRSPLVVRALFAVRMKLGERFGWDNQAPGGDTTTLRDRLPADLRGGPSGPTFVLPFTPLFLLDDEYAAEIANKTMHGVLHLSWVPDSDGGHHGRMSVYVKPNGRLGGVYMAAIKPFRRLIYPQLMRRIEREWRAVTV